MSEDATTAPAAAAATTASPPTTTTTTTTPASAADSTSSTTTPAAAAKWYDSLPEDVRGNPSITKFESPAELAKGYINASQMIGRDKIPMPKTDEEFKEVMFRLGVPKASTDYKIGFKEQPDCLEPEPDAPPDPRYCKTFAEFKENFKKVAHGMSLTNKQCQAAWSYFKTSQKEGYEMTERHIANEMAACATDLDSSWGANKQANVQIANSVLNKLFGKDLSAKIINTGLGRDAKFIKALHSIGTRTLEELGIDKRGQGAASKHDMDAELAMVQAHPGYFDNKHPEHKALVARVTKLMQMRYPQEQRM